MMINVIVGNNMGRKTVIVDSTETLRSVLEANGVDYACSTTMLDGSPVNGGLDQTFDDFDITEKCYLMAVTKLDNAVKATVAGQAVVIESEIETAALEKLTKYREQALILRNNEEDIFRIKLGEVGSINRLGAVFSGTNGAGKATITVMVPDSETDPVQWIRDKLGVALINLKKIEETLAGEIDEVDKETAEIEDMITVL